MPAGNPAAAAPLRFAAEPTLPGGKVRTYYIAADEVVWDYAPHHRNVITDTRFGPTEKVFVKRGRRSVGSRYLKALYREYTDGTFSARKPREDRWRHLGFLGPAIEAEVGDTIVVHFRNNTRFPTGMHAHGVRYAKDGEGAPYNDGTTGTDKADDAVKPHHEHTYIWQVPDRAGPGPGDSSSAMWMYHGHTDEVADTYAGLVGPLIVTRQGMDRADGSPKDVDREFVTLFEVADENQSPLLPRNIRRFVRRPSHEKRPRKGRGLHDAFEKEIRELPADENFEESNLMHSINGYVYGNGPVMRMKRGERVRWYVMSLGTEVDLHTPHWHGNTLTSTMGMRTDVVQVLAGAMSIVDMQPDDPGTWLYHCHINDHILAGMSTRYTVDP